MALRMKHYLFDAIPHLRYEPVTGRLRASLAGEPALDTRAPVVVWEPRRMVPMYAVPVGDVLVALEATDPAPEPPDLDTLPPMMGPLDFATHTTPGTVVDLVAGSGERRPKAGFLLEEADLTGLVLIDFWELEDWLLEDEPLVGHPHDPFKRIDVVPSSQHVVVELDGQVLAESRRPMVLLETHLPPRFYLPPDDVRWDVLVPSETRSLCAYKGEAAYLSTSDGSRPGADIGWHYPAPLHDAARVRDHVCFWNERVDLVVDGERLVRPVTPWSTPEETEAVPPEDRLNG